MEHGFTKQEEQELRMALVAQKSTDDTYYAYRLRGWLIDQCRWDSLSPSPYEIQNMLKTWGVPCVPLLDFPHGYRKG